jgi:hypothetical protein
MSQNGKKLLQICYHENLVSNENIINEQCPICLDKIIAPKLTECNHKMCTSCLDNWLLTNITCPLCRKTIIKQQSISSEGDALARLHVFAMAFNMSYYLNGVAPPTYSS